MKILKLSAENFKRISVVEIKPDGNLVQITGKNGSGKQQPISEPVLTPNGWRPIGELQRGDYVIGSDGHPTEVLRVFPQAERRTFSVKMSDRSEARCGPEHLWTVFWWNNSKRQQETLTTSALLARGLRNGITRKWSVPVLSAPVEFVDLGEEMPIDPYTLGIILGDGHIEPKGYVTITSWDDEILDRLQPTKAWRGEHELGTGMWSRPLRHLGLAGKMSFEKFIPPIYLRASVEDRRALLFGLMDSDGYAPSNGSWAEFCSTSIQLADDVQELAGSLGYVCKRRAPATKKYRYNGELKEGRLAHLVNIKSDTPPFHLARKIAEWSASVQRPDLFRIIDSIEQVADEDSVCIQVAAADGLYVTKDFILTHNTSCLDAIWCTLEGATHLQSVPIRKGADKAVIQLTLGGDKIELIATRTIRAKKEGGGFNTTLTVETAEGFRAPSPQEAMDKLMGRITMDPLAFTRMKDKEQFDALRSFVPDVDFEELAALNKSDYAKRAYVNRDAKQARAAAEGTKVPDSIDDQTQMVDEAALTEQLAGAGKHNASIDIRKQRREGAALTIATTRATADRLESELPSLIERHQKARDTDVASLKEQIYALEERIEKRQKDAADAITECQKVTAEHAANCRAEADELQTALDEAEALPEPIDTDVLAARITEARWTNEAMRARDLRNRHLAVAESKESEAEHLTKAMEARDKQKAELPVPGLGFGDGVVTIDGLPFDQASDAQQLRTSIAIAIATAGKLRVIRVRDGSLLDEEGLQLLSEMADKADMQVWIERVANDGKVGFVLEDGHLSGVEAELPTSSKAKDGKKPETGALL